MASTYRLGDVAIDWVTLTREGQFKSDGLAGSLLAFAGVSRDSWEGANIVTLKLKGARNTYVGRQVETVSGTLGAYDHTDDNRCMITISSGLSHLTRGLWLPYVATGDWKCTRADIQTTIEGKYDPVKLVELLHGLRSVSLISSSNTRNDGDSVYIGSKNSDRYAVIYEKLKGKHIRLELRHYGDYAQKVALTLSRRNNATHEDILDGTLSTWARMLPNNEASDAIVRKFNLGGYKAKSEYIVDLNQDKRRARWLLEVAMPSIRRCVLSGEYPAGDLYEEMVNTITEVLGDER